MNEEPEAFGLGVQVVDPDVRAHIYSLVTALGGFNGDDADRYVLGDDALACLRDIRRWLRLYDEKYKRMDVARCLGEANLINGDLLPILSLWWSSGQKSKHMSRIALACLELLVPLTWPLEIHGEMTVNHHRHIPYLQQTQVSYKRGLLSYGSFSLLRTIVRIGLPSMAVPRSERTTRDDGILKLILYLLRNIAVITPSTRLAAEGEEEETSRSATINAFQYQDVFALLLTMCSNIGDDFSMQDVVLLEIMFHLVKGVNVEKLFMDDAQRSAKHTDELDTVLKLESSLQREYARNAPTRHGRFGTMIWVKRDDAKLSTVSGQDILKDSQATLQKMDESKKWNKPQTHRKHKDSTLNNDFSTPVHLNAAASRNLRMFVEEFLDSGFNPLFTHVRKAIEREAERVLPINLRQFFYTVAWFLEAERARRARQHEKQSRTERPLKELEPDSFGLIASVLDQETFVFLSRSMQNSFDQKDWEDLNAEMRCFTQILLTVQEMAQSPLDEDQEIAENIQNRIFYEETTHDRVLAIIRGYKDQGFGYLDACTELSHVFLRMLERYSKENVDMQVRSQRRARRKKKQVQAAAVEEEGNNEEHPSENEDILEAERVCRERKFDFKRFAAKFCNQKCVDTFVAFTKYFRELDSDQLRRAHRYFYRVAFKQEMSVLLFRVDILNLFYRMIKGPGAMDSNKPIFKEWEELARQIIRRMTKKIDQRPALITELLFSKMNSTLFYLEYGHEKQTLTSVRRAPAELEVNPADAVTFSEKINIVVGALVMDEQADLVAWVSSVLGSAAEERESWEAQDDAQRAESLGASRAPNPMIAVNPRDDACKQAMFLNAKLRLLMTLIGFERLGMEDVAGASWIVPSSQGSKDLRDIKSTIDKYLEDPYTGDIERDPRQMLRRRYNPEDKERNYQTTLDVNFGSDSEGEDIPDGPLFPPNPRSKAKSLDELKKRRKKRQETDHGEPVDEAILEARRKARLENAQARLAKIKSEVCVDPVDDESDEEADKEFFDLEEKRRKEQAVRVRKALLTGVFEEIGSNTNRNSERKRQINPHKSGNSGTQSKRQRRRQPPEDVDEDDIILGGSVVRLPRHDTEDNRDEDDELSFDDNLAFRRDRGQGKGPESPSRGEDTNPSDNVEPNGDDEYVPAAALARKRLRAGFVIDSDSE
ncbi:putative DNA repair protein (Tof1) [Aspergillus alliaceus]|uniref:putative DNA repair protein (Tof1) n=1 Tax=Petromyces alliaceus TaxID=209559 RepID=UPI0012A63CFC|nr:topoisomerase 1-associated factor 1 [Aspergillus alliaceus]KAB8231057.1 topoisomerase 1-associated factor 1 [Aspergillus alliaceus]